MGPGRCLSFLRDERGKATIHQITRAPLAKRFRSVGARSPSFGFTNDVYWFRLGVDNQTGGVRRFVLVVDYAGLDHVTLFQRDARRRWRVQRSGDTLPFSKRAIAHRTFAFAVTLRPGAQPLYLRVATTGPFNVPVMLYSLTGFAVHQNVELRNLWLFYGLIVGLLLFNVVLYLSTRERSYLLYVAYVASFAMFLFAHNGLGAQYLWPDATGWNDQSLPVFGACAGLFAVLFCRTFLETPRRVPRADRVLLAFAGVAAAGIVIELIAYNVLFYRVATVMMLLVSVLMVWVAVYLLRAGVRQARLYIAAWAALLVGIIVGLLKALGVLPIHPLTTWGYQIGMALEAVMLSLALADRLNVARSELEVLNQTLNERVDTRTQDLRASKEELQRTVHELSAEVEQRKEAQRTQLELERILQQSQKMDAIGRLAGGVAHDMNNVLTVIDAYSQLLREELPEDHRAQRDVAQMLEAAERGRTLTASLLAFARKGRYQRRPVDLADTAQSAATLLSRTIAKNIRVRCELEAERSIVDGDPNQLHHALMNICINAVDAVGGEGELLIRVDNVELGDGEVRDCEPGEYLRLQVVDDGEGMDEETVQRATEPFYTTKEAGKGTGLGLAMVYGTAGNHGGALSIESTVDAGTTVTMLLPVFDGPLDPRVFGEAAASKSKAGAGPEPEPAAKAEPEPAAKAEPEPEPAAKPKQPARARVLVVDDDERVRRVTARLLRLLRYEVDSVGSGAEAVARIQEAPAPDVVLLDMIMPGLDGKQTFERLRAIEPELRVVLFSGYSKQENANEVLANGARGFLSKPVKKAALDEALQAALRDA